MCYWCCKKLNVRVFNLILTRTNETRHIKWIETCKFKCGIDASVCNNEQKWNEDKCRCECKELIGKGVCGRGFIWNPSNFECKCDKLCHVGENLGFENCKCRKKLVNKLAEECIEDIDEVKMAGTISAEDENKQLLHTAHCVIFNNFYSQYWNWYLFSLLQICELQQRNCC